MSSRVVALLRCPSSTVPGEKRKYEIYGSSLYVLVFGLLAVSSLEVPARQIICQPSSKCGT